MHSKMVQTYPLLPESQADENNIRFNVINRLSAQQLFAEHIWLQRFQQIPKQSVDLTSPIQQDQIKHQSIFLRSFEEFKQLRLAMDEKWHSLCQQLKPDDLNLSLSYTSTHAREVTAPLFSLLMHFFNHQAYQRHLILRLLLKEGIDLGINELIVPFARHLEYRN